MSALVQLHSPHPKQRQGAWEVPGRHHPKPTWVQGTSSLQYPASTTGDMGPQGPSALAHVPWGTWRQGALPFTPFPSQQSLLFPAFSFPRSFPLPSSCLTRHLHLFLFLPKVSPSAPEVSWRAAVAVVLWQEEGEKPLSRLWLGSKAPGSVQEIFVTCAGQRSPAVGATRHPPALAARFQGRLPRGRSPAWDLPLKQKSFSCDSQD